MVRALQCGAVSQSGDSLSHGAMGTITKGKLSSQLPTSVLSRHKPRTFLYWTGREAVQVATYSCVFVHGTEIS